MRQFGRTIRRKTVTADTHQSRSNISSIVQIFILALIISSLSEWLGPLPIELGVGKVVLLPMIWALLIGLVLGLARKHVPGPLKLSLESQHLARSEERRVGKGGRAQRSLGAG